MEEPHPEAATKVNNNANGSKHSNDASLSGHTPSTAYYRPPPLHLAAISLRAFLLGVALGASLVLTFYLACVSASPFWRLPSFLAILALFHFLEYYITAAYNPSAAGVSAFLLSTNGAAYNVAHTLAFLECALHFYFRPETPFVAPSSYLWSRSSLDSAVDGIRQSPLIPLTVGLIMMVVGQGVRTVAMIRAGSNFNHIVQTKQKQNHVLVTDGIYGVLRHPSYFGFFWWGLGTQVMLGNGLCLLGYTFVLWRFFRHRIWGKYKFLPVSFSPAPPSLGYLDRRPFMYPLIRTM